MKYLKATLLPIFFLVGIASADTTLYEAYLYISDDATTTYEWDQEGTVDGFELKEYNIERKTERFWETTELFIFIPKEATGHYIVSVRAYIIATDEGARNYSEWTNSNGPRSMITKDGVFVEQPWILYKRISEPIFN